MELVEKGIQRFEVVEEDSTWVVVARDLGGHRFLIKDHDDWLQAHLHASRLNRKLHSPERRLTRLELQRLFASKLRDE